jgi:glycosyltransferase involved in cell wall biosynthesis
MPKVSVIIPCFNLGKYIHEAIDSTLNQTFQDFEIIVVNDGSTDPETNRILDSLDKSRIKVITTENQGLASARNNGIEAAAGEYILPLDADDKIAPAYLEKAVKILDENKNIGIVYCEAEFFGEENLKWDLPEFRLSRILIDNLIFASSFFRKDDWRKVGGYKPEMIYGWEDYEFWLSLIELKREVYRIPETLFFYRKRSDSMAHVMSKEHLYYSYKQIVKNHSELYQENIHYIFEYIYSLRGEIVEKENERIAKDTHIHNLNLEILRLNEEIAKLNAKPEVDTLNANIVTLNAKISSLNFQLSNLRSLTKLLLKSIKKKIGFGA